MKQYLEATTLIDYNAESIQRLIKERGFDKPDDFRKIEEIYNFVKDEILFGYNPKDELPASEVLSAGIGQCNTKASLLIALLRGVGIPARFHASYLDNVVQLGIIPKSMSRLVPDVILHTWVEVYYNSKWITLEGVILDKPYIEGCKKKGIAPSKGSYKGYAIGVNDVNDLKVEWKGENTYIQSAGVVEDLGIFDSPDDCYKLYSQKIGAVKSWIYRSFLSKLMNSRVRKIRG